MSDNAFVIAEVLTSSDYAAAADALRDLAEDREYSAAEANKWSRDFYSPEELEETAVYIKKMREQAARFERVSAQVRQQENVTHG